MSVSVNIQLEKYKVITHPFCSRCLNVDVREREGVFVCLIDVRCDYQECSVGCSVEDLEYGSRWMFLLVRQIFIAVRDLVRFSTTFRDAMPIAHSFFCGTALLSSVIIVAHLWRVIVVRVLACCR